MTEEWEYWEEAIAASQEKSYLDSCPAICRTCRWLDNYYQFGCTQQIYPVTDGSCYMYINHKLFKPLWLWRKYDLSYLLWQAKVWFCEKVLRLKPNRVGSWKQWGYYE